MHFGAKEVIGGILFITGIFLLISSQLGITGNVISERADAISSVLSIILIAGGVVLMAVGKKVRELEKIALNEGITVYDKNHGSVDERYRLIDHSGWLSSQEISLGEFKELIQEFKSNEEIMKLIKRNYGDKFYDKIICEIRKNKLSSKIVPYIEFWKATFGKEFSVKPEYLSEEEKQKIRGAFIKWNGEPDKDQRQIMKHYELGFSSGKKHGKIYWNKNEDLFVAVSKTPSDVRAGRNIATNFINLINEIRKIEAEELNQKLSEIRN